MRDRLNKLSEGLETTQAAIYIGEQKIRDLDREYQEKITTYDEAISKQMSEIEELTLQLSDIRLKIIKDTEYSYSFQEEKINLHQTLAAKAQANNELQAIRGSIQIAKDELTSLEARISQLESEYSSRQAEYAEREEKLTQKEQENSRLGKELQDRRGNLSNYITQLELSISKWHAKT